MEEEKKKVTGDERPEIGIDLGFGGLFKGLGNFIDLLGDMVETGESEVSRSGEFKVKGLGDKGRGIYGFSVRTMTGGMPKVEHFGNIRNTEQGPVVADVREPLVDVFDEEEEILIVVELPGVDEGDVEVEIEEDILTLKTTGERKYAKEILLPSGAKAHSLRQVYKNGILELHVSKG